MSVIHTLDDLKSLVHQINTETNVWDRDDIVCWDRNIRTKTKSWDGDWSQYSRDDDEDTEFRSLHKILELIPGFTFAHYHLLITEYVKTKEESVNDYYFSKYYDRTSIGTEDL